LTGANRHDSKALERLLETSLFRSRTGRAPWLYADKGYDGAPADAIIKGNGYRPRVCRKNRRRGRPWKDRRWVVELFHSWLNRFRKLLVRFEKTDFSYEALMHLAAAVICWRKAGVN